jgi:hypothetical protein
MAWGLLAPDDPSGQRLRLTIDPDLAERLLIMANLDRALTGQLTDVLIEAYERAPEYHAA